MLFEEDKSLEDWFDVCPNSEIDLPDVEGQRVFDFIFHALDD